MPFPNEHACRLREPGGDEVEKVARVNDDSSVTVGETDKHPDVIYEIMKGEEPHPVMQSIRYDKEKFTAEEASKDCEEREGSFEQAVTAAQRSVRCQCGQWVRDYDLSHFSSKGHGKIQPELIKVGTATELIEDKGKHFARFFLLNNEVNAMKWKVTLSSIPKYINAFKGLPYISEPNLEHFGLEKQKDLTIPEILRMQEKFRVGNIIDVHFDQKKGEASAVVEIIDNNVWAELKKGEAIYVSPAIGGFPQEIEGVQVYDEWFPLHLARVEHPAYGTVDASLKRTCTGEEKACVDKLIATAAKHNLCPPGQHYCEAEGKCITDASTGSTDNSINKQFKESNAIMSEQGQIVPRTTTELLKDNEELMNRLKSRDQKLSELEENIRNKDKESKDNKAVATEKETEFLKMKEQVTLMDTEAKDINSK